MAMPCRQSGAVSLLALAVFGSACRSPAVRTGPVGPVQTAPRLDEVTEPTRLGYIRQAQVWRPVDTARLDLKAGPQGRGSFPFDATVDCAYVHDAPLSGATPKFKCRSGVEEHKVKYGDDNGEVFAEVAASRLFWALGFGTDDIYPVRVTCRGCPVDPWLWKTSHRIDEREYRLATIERKFDGDALPPRTSRAGPGASWIRSSTHGQAALRSRTARR